MADKGVMKMSTTAKLTFAAELKDRLSDKLTLKDINIVLEALTDQMPLYEMDRRNDNASQKEFDDMLNLFMDAKRIEGRSEKTLERYKYILNRFRKTDNTPIREITVYNIRNYLSSEKNRGISDNTIRGYRDVFLSFFGWIHREGLIQVNPCANLNPIKCRKEVRLPYSDIDIEKMKECCTTARDKAIVSFLLATGCRISEVCGLNRDDVDFQNLECTVLGKGNKERTVYLDPVSAMQLQSYLEQRTDNDKALFIGKGTERLHPGGIRKRLNEIGEEAGVQNVHPHRFRRTLATNLIDHGMAIQDVAFILGHEKIDTTMKYVYVEKQNVKNSYRKYL